MFRQLGTAVGVTLMGAVFLHHVESDLPSRLNGIDPTAAAQYQASAEHFVPSGTGEVRAATEESIVEGFVLLAWAGGGVSLAAAAAAMLVRHRNAEEPAQAAAPAALTSNRAGNAAPG